MSEQFTCPECDGAWLRDFIFEHDQNCELGIADAATVAQDQERLDEDGFAFIRPCTRAELYLAEEWYGGGLEPKRPGEDDAFLTTYVYPEPIDEGDYRNIAGIEAPTRAEMGR